MRKTLTFVLACSLLSIAASAWSATAFLPRGTIIYGQLDERVTSSSRKFRVGYEPLGSVWKDVEVNGITVIEAGTPVALRISRLSPRGIGGRGAEIEISAMFVEVVGGETLNLRGGYGDETPSRTGLNRALSTFLWPASFIPGRRAVLEEGTVFDMEVPVDTYIQVPDDLIPTISLSLEQAPGLGVSVIYDDFDPASKELPLEIRLCDNDWTNDIVVDSVNDKSIRPIPVTTRSRIYVDNCDITRSYVDIEALSEHFERGINRFTVTLGDLTEETMLNIEM
jgi:hypothetical protein